MQVLSSRHGPLAGRALAGAKLVMALVTVLSVTGPAHAQPDWSLVIGQGEYQAPPPYVPAPAYGYVIFPMPAQPAVVYVPPLLIAPDALLDPTHPGWREDPDGDDDDDD